MTQANSPWQELLPHFQYHDFFMQALLAELLSHLRIRHLVYKPFFARTEPVLWQGNNGPESWLSRYG